MVHCVGGSSDGRRTPDRLCSGSGGGRGRGAFYWPATERRSAESVVEQIVATPMCGICGIFFNNRDWHVQPDVLAGMNRRVIHRGPDDDGFFVEENVGLAM